MEEKPKAVLVIGGGIVGIQTAVNLGDACMHARIEAHQGGSSER